MGTTTAVVTDHDDLSHLISDDLLCELGEDVSILPGKKLKRPSPSTASAAPLRPLSKSRRKTLAKALEVKAKQAGRQALLKSISARDQLPLHHQNVMQSSGRLGHQPTRRQQVQLDFHRAKQNLTAPEPTSRSTSQPSSDDDDEVEVRRQFTEAAVPAFNADRITTVVHVSTRPSRKRRVLLDVTGESAGGPPCDIADLNGGEAVLAPSTPSSGGDVVAPLIDFDADVFMAITAAECDDDDVLSVEPALVDDVVVIDEPIATPAPIVPAFYATVSRSDDVIASRAQLPVYSEEQVIMEAINASDCVLICGATGSGKTTQIPQFLYEGGYSWGASRPGLIGVTQPRRVAALAMSERVGNEMGDRGAHVSHQIRFDSSVSPETHIKFMTDGILLQEIQGDFLLRNYSVIVIDEAHERNLNTDVLLGLLSRIVPLRNAKARVEGASITPLRLVIMSATMRVQDFAQNTNLFSIPPPIVQIDARQHPVTVRFSRRTELEDYVKAAFDKIVRIHERLPPGGILVFLTGKQEITRLCYMLNKRFPAPAGHLPPTTPVADDIAADVEWSSGADLIDQSADLIEDEEDRRACDDIEEGEGDEGDWSADDDELPASSEPVAPVHVLPLHALLSKLEQMKVFDAPPTSLHRQIVVSTNVAETSLTIPNIRYVVDCGREKCRVYDARTGLSSFNVQWISRASAEQRAGRAGRTGPGHAYRLYSSAVFTDKFAEFSAPEINQIPIEGTVLQLKSMGIDHVETFPWPTPPDAERVSAALTLLTRLGALSPSSPNPVTRLGRLMSRLPCAPRFAKMILLAKQHDCIDYMIAIVAALTVDQLYAHNANEAPVEKNDEDDDDDEDADRPTVVTYKVCRRAWSDASSDLLSDLALVCAFDWASDAVQFARDNYLRPKAMFEVGRLRMQLQQRLLQLPRSVAQSLKLAPPSLAQHAILIQIIGAAFPDQIARRWPTHDSPSRSAYQCSQVPTPVYIHPQSALFPVEHQPQWCVYRELCQSSKQFIKGLTAIPPALVYKISPHMCHLSAPLDEPSPVYDAQSDSIHCFVSCTYGPGRWPLPVERIPHPSPAHRARSFASLLLQGQCIPQWKQLRPYLTVRPKALLTPLQTNMKVLAFLTRLAPIDSVAALRARWSREPSFLRVELSHLLQGPAQDKLDGFWRQRGQ